MKRKKISVLLLFLSPVLNAFAQPDKLYDSSLVSKQIDKVAGMWFYGNKAKDTFMVRIEKIPMKLLLHPQAQEAPYTAIVWVYYKRKDSVIENSLQQYFPDKYSISNWVLTGSYLDYAKAVVLLYTDKNYKSTCRVKLVLKNKQKLYWKIRTELEEESKRHNFFYPEKLILRRMKKNLL
jgi:hypothetical protein